MTIPTILFDIPASPGIEDRSRSDVPLGTVVTITAGNVVGTAVFGLLDRPLGSAAVLAGAGLTRTLTLDVVGPYEVRIIDDDDDGEVVHLFSARTLPLQLDLPASNERANPAANDVENDADDIAASTTNEGGTFKGWHDKVTAAFLRLESMAVRSQGTGWLDGFEVTLDTPTSVDIAAGKGTVTDYSTNPGQSRDLDRGENLGIAITDILNTNVTLLAYDIDGVLSQILITDLTAEDRVDKIIVGAVSHVGGIITKVGPIPSTIGYDSHTTLFNFLIDVIGPANAEGNIVSGNVGGNLSIDCTGGKIFDVASNVRVSRKLPDFSTTSPEVAPNIPLLHADASGGFVVFTSTPFTDPSVYQDAPNSTAAVLANGWTIQRVFRASTGDFQLAMGQEIFPNQNAAIDALLTHSFVEFQPLPPTAFLAFLVIKGNATDLTDTAQAMFFAADKFRTRGAGGAGAPGANSFLAMQDTPNSYSGQSGLVPHVNDTEDALVFASVGGGGSITLEWGWLTDIIDSDPGSGNVKGNNATQSAITQLNISDVTGNGKDVSSLLSGLGSGDVFIITEESDSARWIVFELSGDVVDQTTYFELPGTVVQNGTAIRNARTTAVQIFAATAKTFLALQDTPGTYAGQALLMPRVNAAETALEFTNVVVSEVLNGVFIGDGAGNFPTLSGIDNTAVGDIAGAALTTGFANTLVGHGAGTGTAGGAANTGIGDFSLASVAAGSLNVGVGAGSASAATGSNGVYIGGLTGSLTTSGERQTLVGCDMEARFATQDDVIAIGCLAAGNAGQLMVVDPALSGVFLGSGTPGNWPTLSGIENTVIGDDAGLSLTTAFACTLVGHSAGDSITTGAANVAIGDFALAGAVGGFLNTAVGNGAGFSATGANNTFIGGLTVNGASTGSRLVVIGADMAPRTAAQSDLIAIGSQTGGTVGQLMVVDPGLNFVGMGASTPGNWPALTGVDNTAIGDDAGGALTTGSNNTFVGSQAADSVTVGDSNAALGVFSMAAATDADRNVSIGHFSMAALTLGDDNVSVGYAAGDTITTGVRNIFIGSEIDTPTAGHNDLIAIGSQRAGNAGQLMVVDPAITGVFIGSGTPGNWPTLTGVDNVVIGSGAGAVMTTAHHNVAIGEGALASALQGDRNVALGPATGNSITSGRLNVFVGSIAGGNTTTGLRNIIIGASANAASAGQSDLIAIGAASGGNAGQRMIVDPALTSVAMGSSVPGNWPTVSGLDNVSIGDNAGGALTTGSENTFLGSGVAPIVTIGADNVVIGFGAAILATNIGLNTIVGHGAVPALTTGARNVVIGQAAGGPLAAGSRNILIGELTTTPAGGTSDHLNIGNTVYGELASKQIRIGGSGQVTGDASLELANADKALLLSRLTTVQEGALTAVNGMLIYNTTTNKFRGYENGAWANLI